MPTTLDLDAHVAAIADAGAALAERAEAAGLDASVPTCPGWAVRNLVAHQAMVHRWAAANLTEPQRAGKPPEGSVLEHTSDVLGYYREGVGLLLKAIREVPDDVDARVFLPDAPQPRRFWARRQAHETTIHAVDALAAQLGRVPVAAEVGLDPALALDGVDELLCGFVPCADASALYSGQEETVSVRPTDANRAWTVRIRRNAVSIEVGVPPECEFTFTGTAAQLYLGLSNRGEELRVAGRSDLLARWRKVVRLSWD